MRNKDEPQNAKSVVGKPDPFDQCNYGENIVLMSVRAMLVKKS
jgi:hypothetical protein